MSIAFYAPMKHPDHTVPSGDRTIARSLVSALRYAGADVTIASQFQSRDGKGNSAVQKELLQQARIEADRMIEQGKYRKWRAWITYHNYYKAPDLLGPAACQALEIPYIQVESTRARKRLSGAWATFAQAAEKATDRAALVFHFTSHDAEALRAYAPPTQKLRHLRPFLDRKNIDDAVPRGSGMLAVGMMRERDKLQSYELIAQTLHLLDGDNWTLAIAGDGPAREQVAALFRPFGSKVRLLGAMSSDQLAQHYAAHGIFFWPGVNEAFGMAYLEAQAAGLAIVAQDRAGVRDVLPAGVYPSPDEGPPALAARLQALLVSADKLKQAQLSSFENARRHLLPAAADTLREGFREVGVVL